ncbi:MAG: GHKL domain-containing protein [Clostridia bacterium]|nr:GHKL domain-containing protein [Clostridia bacterium]
MGIVEIVYGYSLSVFCIVLVFLIAYLQLKINKSELRQWSILALACSLITNISILFQILNVSNSESGVWYEAFALIGMTLFPVCIFFAVTCFINSGFVFSRRHSWLFLIPIISIVATFTNQYHHLIFKTFSTNLTEREYGALFYVMFASMIITCVLAIFRILKYLSKNIQKYKFQIAISFAFLVVPVLLLLLGNLRIINVKSYLNGVLESAISIITVELLLKYQLLTIIPVSLANVLNAITDGFVVINKNGIILSYNQVFRNLFDLGKLDIRRMNIKELLDFKEFDTISEEDIDNITKIEDYHEKLTFERTSEKLKLTLRYEGTPLLEKKKNYLFLISIVDITGYSKDIQSIKLNKDALLSRERLASLGQMIGGIAHNLKTPIFSIAGAIEGIEELVQEYQESIPDETVTVEDHHDIAKDMYEWTDKIQGYLSYMTDIITAIQMQTSAEYGKSTDGFSIKELVKYINVLMKYELKHNLIDLEVNIKMDEETKIIGNINNLIQVLNNLMSNSIQAYAGSEKEKKIVLDIYEKKNEIYIEVTDFAGGIPEDIKNKLFKEMVTTKGKNGTGLGLFISYTSIKTGFGGNLCFTTKEGVGTTFRIIIPK